MGRLDDIEKAVSALSPAELLEFRAWFEEFEAARFDGRIERDMSSGKLDKLADEALRNFQEGRAREL
jgi:hypothetical protein